MEENLKDKTRLRSYLLGQITDQSELDLIEERLLTDEEYLDELSVAESGLIDEYVFGKLEGIELENFKKLFLTVEERAEKINFARALNEYARNSAANEPERPGFFERLSFSHRISLAFMASIFIVGFISLAIFWRQSSIENTREKIVSIYEKERPVSGRVTGFKYAPLITLRGTGDPPNDDRQIRLSQIELELREEIRNNPSAENLHLLGVFYLLRKRFDESISQFESALKIKPNDAEILSDLGTAYLEKSKLPAEDKMLNLRKSLVEFEKAFQADHNRIEALFNLALVFQEMNQSGRAIETWKQYLEKDQNSGWADEARQNLKKLEH